MKLPRIIKPLENLDDLAIIIVYFKEPTRSYSYKSGRKYGKISFRDLSFRIEPKIFEYLNKLQENLTVY